MFLIFALILALRVDESSIQESPGYATACTHYTLGFDEDEMKISFKCVRYDFPDEDQMKITFCVCSLVYKTTYSPEK